MTVDPRLLEIVADRLAGAPERGPGRMAAERLGRLVAADQRLLAAGRAHRPIDEAIDAAEAFYAARGLPRPFQAVGRGGDPGQPLRALARAGLQAHPRHPGDGGRGIGDDRGGDGCGRHPVGHARPGLRGDPDRQRRRQRRRRPRAAGRPGPHPPAGLLRAAGRRRRGGGLGRSAIDGEWAGIFGMRTLPGHRRKGLASRILAALLHEARTLGARRSLSAGRGRQRSGHRALQRRGSRPPTAIATGWSSRASDHPLDDRDEQDNAGDGQQQRHEQHRAAQAEGAGLVQCLTVTTLIDHAQHHGARFPWPTRNSPTFCRLSGRARAARLDGGLQELVDREPEAEHRQRGAQPGHQRAVRRQHGAHRAEVGGEEGAGSWAFGHGLSLREGGVISDRGRWR